MPQVVNERLCLKLGYSPPAHVGGPSSPARSHILRPLDVAGMTGPNRRAVDKGKMTPKGVKALWDLDEADDIGRVVDRLAL